MCASMSLREPHSFRIVSDTQAAKLAIRKAFNILREMSSQEGEQVEKSKEFLLSLLKTTLRTRGQVRESLISII